MDANDGWIYQGRQAHGWFGSGTAPKASGSTAANDGRDLDERIHAVISATVAEFSASERRTFERQLSNGMRAQLSAAMKGWIEGASLDAEAFRVRYFGPW